MAVEQEIYDISLNAVEDLSDYQFHWMKGSGEFGFDLAGAADEDLCGILQDKPAADGRAGEIRRVGISKVVCGGTITAWDKVTSDADGHGVTAGDSERYGGIALEPGVVGRVISILMEFGYTPPAAS